MAQYPANIDLASLDGTNGFKINGVSANNYVGASVSSAGDVNGDGFADVIVGAYRTGPAYAGASYVVFGGASGFAANVDVSSLDGTSGFRISGEAAYDASGISVSTAGDVNGDGFDDVIVGAFVASPMVTAPGRATSCSARLRALRRTSTCRAWMGPTASSSAAKRREMPAAARSLPPATSTATASPT